MTLISAVEESQSSPSDRHDHTQEENMINFLKDTAWEHIKMDDD